MRHFTCGPVLTLAFCCLGAAVPTTGLADERPCHIDGVETPVTCVTIDVPRDYAAPDGSTITVTAVVVPASTGRPAPEPLVVLAGGPGQSATSVAGALQPLLAHVRRQRDVVLLDARGTGLSEPLDCELELAAFAAEGEPPPPATIELVRGTAADCARALGKRVHHHTDRELVEDIERFRVARGYPQLNLWGGSFGTRVAQHYIRAYGDRVRAVVLDSVTPAGTSLLVTAAPSADAALAKVFAACGTDTGCSTTFPQLPATFEQLLAAASTAPITVAAVDPVTGLRGNATFDYVLLSETVRLAVYSRAVTEILPFAIDAAAGGNWAPLLGIGAIRADVSVSLGMQLSVLCAEDWPMARDAGAAARAGGFMRDGFYEIFAQACTTWPRARLPAEMLEPFASSVPALAISGEFDPVTPPELAEQALRQFSTGVHVVVPNGFHGNSENPCVARIIASFLSDPATGGRDHECASATPPLRFFTGPSS